MNSAVLILVSWLCYFHNGAVVAEEDNSTFPEELMELADNKDIVWFSPGDAQAPEASPEPELNITLPTVSPAEDTNSTGNATIFSEELKAVDANSTTNATVLEAKTGDQPADNSTTTSANETIVAGNETVAVSPQDESTEATTTTTAVPSPGASLLSAVVSLVKRTYPTQ